MALQAVPSQGAVLEMSASAHHDPLSDLVRKLVACIRMLSSDKPFEVEGALSGVQRLLKGVDGVDDIHALADRIENGGISGKYQEEIRAQIKKAHEVGYEKGVRAAEARFRPDGKLEFNEVALFVERQINRLPPDKHEFIHKMAFYARQEFEPTQKQGKFLFDLFVQYLGGRIT
jgi:hypothetical protein